MENYYFPQNKNVCDYLDMRQSFPISVRKRDPGAFLFIPYAASNVIVSTIANITFFLWMPLIIYTCSYRYDTKIRDTPINEISGWDSWYLLLSIISYTVVILYMPRVSIAKTGPIFS